MRLHLGSWWSEANTSTPSGSGLNLSHPSAEEPRHPYTPQTEANSPAVEHWVEALDPFTVWSYLASGAVRLIRRPRVTRKPQHVRAIHSWNPRRPRCYSHRRMLTHTTSEDDPSQRTPLERGLSSNPYPLEVAIG